MHSSMKAALQPPRSKPTLHPPQKAAEAVSGSQGNFVFGLLAIYLFFDLIRPPFVWHFPKILSVILVVAWVAKASKVWCPQMTSYVCFLGIMVIGVFQAANTFDATWATYGMFMLLMGVCCPLINFTDSLNRVRRLIYAVLAIFLGMAIYAILNNGYGPAGAGGGQDENYVAAGMNLVIPLALFSLFAEQAFWKRVFFAICLGCYLLAIVVGLSRGGFVGLVCSLGFALWKTPKKGLAIFAAVLIAGFLIAIAGPSYWEEMSTITDTSEGTADLRFEFWKIAIQEFLAYPLTGVGPDNYRWRIGEFMSLEQYQKFDRVLVSHVHSTYFQLLAEMGTAGVVVFSVFLFQTFRDYRFVDRLPALCHTNGPVAVPAVQEELRMMQAYARGLTAGMVGYLASIAFLSSLYYSHLWIAASIMAALCAVARQRLKSGEGESLTQLKAEV